MSTQPPTHDPEITKPPVSEARFWFSVVEATDAAGKLDYENLAEMVGYKNWQSAKAVFFGKRKQMRVLYGVKGDDNVKKEPGKVEDGVKKRGRKKKEIKKVEDVPTEEEKRVGGVLPG